MKILYTVLITMSLCFLGSCKSSQTATWEGRVFTGQIDPKVDKLLAGREVFADAERVIPVLVDSNEGSGVKKENLEGYAITKKANLLTPEQIKRLQKVVFDVETYDFNLSKRCPFHPYVGFIFEKGGKKAHALFCFQCNEVSYGRDGKQGNIEDFDSARAEILALSKEVFHKILV